jgi:uncharacterized protein DUF4154
MRHPRWVHRLVCGAIWAGACGLGPQIALAQAPLEYQVKAAFLYHFASFTQWPAAAFASTSSPLRICVYRDPAFVTQMEATARGESAQGHPLVVAAVARQDEAGNCHILFVPQQETPRAAALLRGLESAPVLTVGESDVFLRDGGIVNFVIEEGHVRFDINDKLARQRSLALSSKLLKVARSVQ